MHNNLNHEKNKMLIVNYVAIINDNLSGTSNFFAKNDVNKDNVRMLSESIQDISESKMAINELYDDFSASQINQFTVKWIDGRQMSLGNWETLFIQKFGEIVSMLNHFCENYK